jgi:hypothetical protein
MFPTRGSSSALAIAGVFAALVLASPSAGSAATGLVGRWTRVVTKADVARTKAFRVECAACVPTPSGRATLVFTSGQFRATDSHGFTVAENYSVGGGLLHVGLYVNLNDNQAFCPPTVAERATYTWSVTGTTLSLSPTKDPCADRDSLLTGTWRKVGR